MIRLELQGNILLATMERSVQNTIDEQLVEALRHALFEAARQDAVLLHLRSGTPHFCGGADPARVRRWLDSDGCDALRADGESWARLFEEIETAPTIVLAEMRGNALGAGLGLALACDLRIAAASARIGVPEVRVGLLPAGMTVRRLVELVGNVAAQRLLLGGDIIDGTEAHRLGMMHWLVADEQLEGHAADTARRVAKQSPAALREAKQVLTAARREDRRATFAREGAAFSKLISSDEPRARIQALLGRLAAADRK